MKLDDILKASGGVVGLGVIGVTGYFVFRYAVWPHLNSEDGDEPKLPMPTPPQELLEETTSMPTTSNSNVIYVEGWRWGQRRKIAVTEVEKGFYLDTVAADFYVAMREDAKAQGVNLKINTAYRTMAEQQRLYALYKSGQGAKAALPGWSNHQMGLALDIESAGGTNAAFHWLTANAYKYKFKRTVASEPWHWEYVA